MTPVIFFTFFSRRARSLAALVQRESNVLAYIDGFWLTFWLAILALGFVAHDDEGTAGPVHAGPVRRRASAGAAVRMVAVTAAAATLVSKTMHIGWPTPCTPLTPSLRFAARQGLVQGPRTGSGGMPCDYSLHLFR
jgi:hypothetical protein